MHINVCQWFRLGIFPFSPFLLSIFLQSKQSTFSYFKKNHAYKNFANFQPALYHCSVMSICKWIIVNFSPFLLHPEAICQIVGAAVSNKDSTSEFLYSSIHSQADKRVSSDREGETDAPLSLSSNRARGTSRSSNRLAKLGSADKQ